MKKIWRIPTSFGLILILIIMILGAIAIHQGTNWFFKAQSEIIPRQIKITNLSSNSLTLSWLTDTQETGSVKYGLDQKLNLNAGDDRDTNSSSGQYLTHYVTLKNLEPETTYFFKIHSGGKDFDNNGQPFEITTAPAITGSPPPSDAAYGTVVNPDGSPAEGIVVYLSLKNTTDQSTLTKTSGHWMIPLNLARSADLRSYTEYDKEASVEQILVQAGPNQSATAITTTAYDNPLPTITLGESYDFRETPPETVLQEEPPAESKFVFNRLPTIPPSAKELTITNPEEGESIHTAKPLIFGTAPAGTTISITIESDQTITGTAITDENGDWQWSPTEDLELGQHTITISYLDSNNLIHSIRQVFTVLATGEQFPAFEATPSASLTPSVTPTGSIVPTGSLTPSPTTTPITGLTITPTVSITGSPTMTTTPTSTISASLTPTATAEGELEEAGFGLPLTSTLLAALVLVCLGLVLAF